MQAFESKAASEADLPALAEEFLNYASQANGTKVFCFDAPMGSGKTTFIKTLCRQLGVTEQVSSPTYALVNQYSAGSDQVYHFDLYRLKSAEEAMDIGFDEYVESGDYCFIEWPDLIIDKLQVPFLHVQISVAENIRYFRATVKNL